MTTWDINCYLHDSKILYRLDLKEIPLFVPLSLLFIRPCSLDPSYQKKIDIDKEQQ